MLVSATAFAPLASADQGLVVLTFIGPEGQGEGQTITVNIEAYQDGVPVNLDDLNVSAGMMSGIYLTFTNPSTGKYTATYTISASDASSGFLSLFGSAMLGAATESIFQFYTVGGGGGGGSGWDIEMRIANMAQVGIVPGPGASVVVEARSYNAGALADGGQINFTVNWVAGVGFGGSPTPVTASSTKVSDGVYQTTVDVPADLASSRSYSVEGAIGTGMSAPHSSTGFSAHPFTVMTVTQSSTTTSATVTAYVGLNSPISGAQLSLSGNAVTMTPPYFTTVGPFTGTSDANGVSTLSASWGATTAPTFWTLNVTANGKMTSVMLSLMAAPSGPQPFMPQPPIGIGCEAITQVDTTAFAGGQTANMKFRVTNDGAPVASQSLPRYAWRVGALASAAAGNVTTDATGNFTMTWVVPADWDFVEDSFQMRVYCTQDEYDTVYVAFGGGGSSGGPFGDGKVQVTASGRLGGPVSITATYSGTNALAGAQAVAVIVPGNQSMVAGVGLAGGGLSTPLTRAGSTFTGSITVPAWMGSGNYTVLALITNEAATSSQSDQTTTGNMTVINLTPQGSTSGTGGTGGTGGGFIPGFEGAAAVAAVAAIGALLVVGRRRRQA
jgi:hypothetical protein